MPKNDVQNEVAGTRTDRASEHPVLVPKNGTGHSGTIQLGCDYIELWPPLLCRVQLP
jgi:hypothetical protein